MTCSFDVKDGKLVNVQYDEGDFNCSDKQLTSLKGSPKKIKGDFDCYDNQLATLKGSPEEVSGDFNCSHNKLKSLKGCPKKVGEYFGCGNNSHLEDISDVPSSCRLVNIGYCLMIKKFPEKIDDTLEFLFPLKMVRERIKKVSFYEVVKEEEDSITVRQKSIGGQLLDEL